MSATTATAGQPGPLRRWIINHDNSRLFVVAYIGLALVLSVFVSLFWLVFVVGLHVAFELVRQHHAHPAAGGVVARTAWETKLDVGLVLFALALAVYLEFIFGLAGLSAAGRLGAQGGARLAASGGARFAAWQQVLRATLLSADDAAQIVRGVASRRRGGRADEADAEEPAPITRWGGWRGRWTWGDRLSLGFGVVCLVLLLAAPLVTGSSMDTVLATLVEELQPLP
jgi:membrane-associated protease RseP (regulator of RpoE activity)